MRRTVAPSGTCGAPTSPLGSSISSRVDGASRATRYYHHCYCSYCYCYYYYYYYYYYYLLLLPTTTTLGSA